MFSISTLVVLLFAVGLVQGQPPPEFLNTVEHGALMALLDAIGESLHKRGVLFSVDAIQTLGAFPFSVRFVDFLSADAHAGPAESLSFSIACSHIPAHPGVPWKSRTVPEQQKIPRTTKVQSKRRRA